MASIDDHKAVPGTPHTLDFFGDVPLGITVELGRAEISVRQLLSLTIGSVLELGSLQGESLLVRINGNPCAKGEVVAVNDHYGVRITEIVEPSSSS
jgi:flagellar motor switch protein FliN/FliY